MPSCSSLIKVQTDFFDPALQTTQLHTNSNTGAVATFSGYCRSEEGRLSALELEHYPGMAQSQLKAIAEEAIKRWPLFALHVIHRHGIIKVGEPIVFVGASASHRRAAFDTVDFIMDFLKTDAPFWKKEHLINGKEADWVKAKDIDEAAKARWEEGK